MATTVVSYGMVKMAAMRGQPMPEGWMVDHQGKSLTDSRRPAEGLLLPIGGYKRCGLALIVGLLAGVSNQDAFCRDVIDFNADDRTPTNSGQAIIALDVGRFQPIEEFRRQVDVVIEDMRACRKIPGVTETRVLGQQGYQQWIERSKKGIRLSASVINNLQVL